VPWLWPNFSKYWQSLVQFASSSMKLTLLAVVFASLAGPLLSVEVGDRYKAVVDEMGLPLNQMESGGSLILTYADSSVRLHDDKVVTMKIAGVEAGFTYQKVVEQRGAPTSKIEVRGTQILSYLDVTIKLREGKVVAIKNAGRLK
jgi:hypothetical protein